MSNPSALVLREPGPLTSSQMEDVHTPLEKWSDDFAIKIFREDFNSAETYRSTNHDWRFRSADELYLAWVAQKYWEGTRVPRSSLSSHLTFEQIEALLPKVLSAIFGDNPWFECDPRPGTPSAYANATQYLLEWQTAETLLREEVRRGCKSAFTYGNGILEMGYETIEKERKLRLVEMTPKKMSHPLLGSIPTGEFTRNYRWRTVKETINRPWVKYRSIKDFYIDPNCQSPFVKDARYAYIRAWMTVDEVDALREQDDFKIPSRGDLLYLAQNKLSTQGDQTKSVAEAYRDVSYNPWVDQTADPAGKRIEVTCRWSGDRLLWALNRQTLIYNQANPYGFIPLYNIVYTDVLDRFYGLAISDVNEGEQRFQTALLNARVDELSLAIHPQTIKRRGVNIPAAQLRRRVGGILEVDDPEKDIIREVPMNITQSAYLEQAASENRAQKATGLTDLAVLGTPSSGGNAASRTATGVSTQSAASFSRIQYLIENIESGVLEPLLFDMHTLNTRYLDPDKMLQVLGPDGKEAQIDPLTVINAEVRLSMRAGSRVQSRAAVLQAFPLISQTLLNPAFLSMLAQQQGKTIDVEELSNLILEASGYKSRVPNLFRRLTPEEQQMMNQPPPGDTMKMKMQEARLASAGENAELNALTKVMSTVLGKELGKPEEKEESEND